MIQVTEERIFHMRKSMESVIKANNVRGMRGLVRGGLDPNAMDFDAPLLQHFIILATDEHAPMLNVMLGEARRPYVFDASHGTSPLLEAICGKKIKLAEVLIAHGLDVNWKNSYDYSLVHRALEAGDKAVTFLDMLERNGARMDVISLYGQTPLAMAYDNTIAVRWLLHRIPRLIDLQDTLNQSTALMNAIFNSPSEESAMNVADVYLEFGVDLSVRNAQGRTASEVAANKGYLSLANYLHAAEQALSSRELIGGIASQAGHSPNCQAQAAVNMRLTP